MSESQFTYSGMTLDELRSLAASPQVGTIQAMPQSFRSLAERVGDVADLLAHAQTDLPNWWRGPAAEQAATTLGRAAAEAREFHESAIGAATAVGRCAQIVAEQQHQMMNVPELPEPGVTDVVRRPTTPFEALEAARQDAAYQAAHEQAVQVVNGIAAQYVETRGQLAEIGAFSAENFSPSAATLPSISNTEAASSNSMQSRRPRETRDQHLNELQTRPKSVNAKKAIIKDRDLASPRRSGHELRELGIETTPTHTQGHTSRETKNTRTFEESVVNTPPGHSTMRASSHDTETAAGDTAASTPQTDGEREPRSPDIGYDPVDKPSQFGPGQDFANRNTALHSGFGHASGPPSNPASRSDRNAQSADTSDGGYNLNLVQNSATSQPSPDPSAYQPQSDSSGNEHDGMIPPYSGVGAVHRMHDERSPRPAYLKERKNAWVSDTVAAPADGVITLDWLEHH